MKPLVSVVTATRNYARFVGEALRSVQAQTFTDWEMVVVDDGSTDNTAEVVRPFLSDARFRYIRSDSLGQSRAKNLAITLSRAPLLAFLDGDDIWLPQKLARQYALLQEKPDIGVVFTRRSLIDEQGAPLPSPQPVLPRGDSFARFVVGNPVCYSSVMLRRDVLDRVGMFDPRLDLAIDYDLWLRVSRHFTFDYIDEVLVRYRTGHANLSRRLRERVHSVLSTMRRCLVRRGGGAKATRAELTEAWGSTYRSMAYAVRDKNPGEAAAWYLRAAGRDWRFVTSGRSILATFGAWLMRKLR